MKITHLYWSLTYGGIETMLVNIANAQIETGVDVSIIIINNLYEKVLLQSINPNIKLYCLNREPKGFGLWAILKLNILLHKTKPDVIHLHRSDIFPLILGKKNKQKACVTLHALPLGSTKHNNFICTFLKKILKKSIPYSNLYYIDKISQIYSISNAVKESLKINYNIESTVIYNGVKTSSFKQRKIYKKNQYFRIVQVSRLEHEQKGQDLLIKAIANLKDQVTIDFIGTGASLNYLKQLVLELGLQDNVSFLGKKDQQYIAEHLAEYDLFVQPSRWEGFGLTVAEAMSALVPVLVSANQGPAEVTCDNKYGWTFTNGDVNDLTDKIVYIINHYDEVLLKANDAYTYVKNNFDVSVTAKRYIEEYNKTIQIKTT